MATGNMMLMDNWEPSSGNRSKLVENDDKSRSVLESPGRRGGQGVYCSVCSVSQVFSATDHFQHKKIVIT